MSNQPTFTITLSNGSTAVLRHLLNQPNWAKPNSEFYTACELLAVVVPETPEQPERPHPIATPSYKDALVQWKKDEAGWSGGTIIFTVTDKQRDVIKTCLKAAKEKQSVVPSKPAFDLFTAFGLIE